MSETQTRNQCRHIHTAGHRCASPSLRHEAFCYYHHTTRGAVLKSEAQARIEFRQEGNARQSTFTLFDPEDRTAIQLNLGEIMRRIAANEIDPKRAGLLLYALQIASSNLPRPAAAQPQTVAPTIEEITLDETHGTLAPVAEFQSAPHEKSLEEILLEQWHKDDLDEAEHAAEAGTPPCPMHDSLSVMSGSTQEPTPASIPTTIPTIQAVAEAPHPKSTPNPNPLNTLHQNRGEGYLSGFIHPYPSYPRCTFYWCE